ncbi:MAG: seryl-tRNA synthetase [Patescibacteria group bacterium]|nr:seryl-tRNA synthetase [Patescibacteria group bacterium]
MLDIKFIRENIDRVKASVISKNLSGKVDVDLVLKLDDEMKALSQEADVLRQEKNKIDSEMKKNPPEEDKKKLIASGTDIKNKLKVLEENLNLKQAELLENMQKLPNVTSPKMPVGKNEDENVSVRTWGEIPKFDFTPLDHVELGKRLKIIDVEKTGDISGSRFYYFLNEAVLMQFGIIQLVFEALTNPAVLSELAKKVGSNSNKTFIPVIPPVMIKPEVMKQMDRLDPIDERYVLKNDDLVLVGSAEHTLGPLHMNEILDESQLPIRYIGYSTAFRREAGSHGKDVRGIFRVHQFDKLEMESFTTVEQGELEQDFIVAIQEYLVQQLELPYQVIQICTGDSGKPDYNQYDIECWMPSHNRYRETHTSDYMTDYQARRLNIKYKLKNGEKNFVHMNDATAFALSRTMLAIVENYQQKDGSVVVPKALRKYVGKDVITPKN